MTTRLEKTLKRELSIKGSDYVVAISPEGLKVTLKGHRKGLELSWDALVSGDAALAVALNASVGHLDAGAPTASDTPASEPRSPQPRQKGAPTKLKRKPPRTGRRPPS